MSMYVVGDRPVQKRGRPVTATAFHDTLWPLLAAGPPPAKRAKKAERDIRPPVKTAAEKLFDACDAGNATAVSDILRTSSVSADVFYRDTDEHVLFWAIRAKRFSVVRALIKNGAQTHFRDVFGMTFFESLANVACDIAGEAARSAYLAILAYFAPRILVFQHRDCAANPVAKFLELAAHVPRFTGNIKSIHFVPGSLVFSGTHLSSIGIFAMSSANLGDIIINNSVFTVSDITRFISAITANRDNSFNAINFCVKRMGPVVITQKFLDSVHTASVHRSFKCIMIPPPQKHDEKKASPSFRSIPVELVQCNIAA